MTLNLKGLVAAPHTPFHEDGSLAPEQVAPQAQWLARSGVVGAFISGTTGEWCSMTTQERTVLFEAWAQCDTKVTRIAHVGHNCQADAIELASQAGKLGLDAISAVAPSFLKPGSPKAVADFFAPIAAAGGGLPFYVYHIPGLSGVNVPAHEQVEACAQCVPHFAGLKFTDPDLFAYARCMQRYADRFEFMWGVDEILLAALPYGAQSAVGSTYNYAAPIYNNMLAAYHTGDTLRARQEAARSVALVDLLLEFGVMQAGKALMTLRGIECGPTRLPVPPLSQARREALFERVNEAGLLDEVPDPQSAAKRSVQPTPVN
ncbi:MAG: dihydrodipicolinate synthase family protein [Phycisphaerales bacterium JB063]